MFLGWKSVRKKEKRENYLQRLFSSLSLSFRHVCPLSFRILFSFNLYSLFIRARLSFTPSLFFLLHLVQSYLYLSSCFVLIFFFPLLVFHVLPYPTDSQGISLFVCMFLRNLNNKKHGTKKHILGKIKALKTHPLEEHFLHYYLVCCSLPINITLLYNPYLMPSEMLILRFSCVMRQNENGPNSNFIYLRLYGYGFQSTSIDCCVHGT